jgi:hypothetical protein
MPAASRLIGYRLGGPMTAIYSPEHQQPPPQPSARHLHQLRERIWAGSGGEASCA